MKRAAFLDRDGVINRKPPEGQYVMCWEEMQFLPDVGVAIALLNRAGLCVIVVTNQRCVTKGLVAAPVLEAMHQRMCDELALNGAKIDAVYYCPHDNYPPCSCRKPAPGMLLAAALRHDIDLSASWIIGDSDSDTQAGRTAGCRTAQILGNNDIPTHNSDVVGACLLEAVCRVLNLSELPRVAR